MDTTPAGYLVKWDWWAFPGLWGFDTDTLVSGALDTDPPLSDELLGQLARWISDGDVQGGPDDADAHDALIEWNARGRDLAGRVRAEVPEDIPVWWFDEVASALVPVVAP